MSTEQLVCKPSPVELHAPTDDDALLIHCKQELYIKALLLIEFEKTNLIVRRADKKPIQVRRFIGSDGESALAFCEPESAVLLSTSQTGACSPLNFQNVDDAQTASLFALHVYNYTLAKLRN